MPHGLPRSILARVDGLFGLGLLFLCTITSTPVTLSVSASQIITWQGAGLPGGWNNPANWSPASVPSASDTVMVDSGTVTVPPEAVFAVLNLNGGTLTGTNTLHGTMNWTRGDVASAARLKVASDGVLNIAVAWDGSSSSHLYGVLTNAGAVQLGNSTGFSLCGSAIYNLEGALFDLQNDSSLWDAGCSPSLFDNAGLVRKSGGMGTSYLSVALANTGTVEVQSGWLSHGSGSRFSAGTVFSGAGTNLLDSGGVTFNGPIVSSNAELAGATLNGTSVVSGRMNWTDGTLDSASGLTIPYGAVLNLSGGRLDGVLTNAGTVQFTATAPRGIWEEGSFTLCGTICNLATGVFDIQTDSDISGTGCAGPLFDNAGLLRKSGGGGTSSIRIALANTGTVEVQRGWLSHGSGGRFSAGTVFSGAGTNLLNSGGITFNGVIASSNAQLAGATLKGTNVVSGTLNWTAGTVDSAARLTIPNGSVLNWTGGRLNGVLTNSGSVQFRGSGFTLCGTIRNLADGVFDIQNNSSLNSGSCPGQLFHNAGLLRKSGGIGTSYLYVPLANTGTVDVQSGGLSHGSGSTFSAGTVFSGAGTNLLADGTVTFNGPIVSGNAELGGAALQGASVVSGTMIWSRGDLASAAQLTVATNGVLNLAAQGSSSYLHGVLINAGTVQVTNNGLLKVCGGAIHNLVGALFDFQDDSGIGIGEGSCPGQPFDNAGLLRKSGGGGTSSIKVALANTGTVEAQRGWLRQDAGGTFSAGAVFSGTVTFNGPIFSSNAELAGATLNGTSVVSGRMSWTGGTLGSAARLTIPYGSVLNLSGGRLDGVLTNAGTVQFTETGPGESNLTLCGTIRNLATGVFDIQAGGNLRNAQCSAGLFDNAGVLRKSGGAGISYMEVPLSNTATLDVQAGGLSIGSGNTLGTGTVFSGAGAILFASGTVTFNGVIASSNVQLAGATLKGTSIISGRLNWAAGALDSAAALTIPKGSVLNVSGGTLNGLVSVASGGVLNIAVDVSREFDLNGVLINSGTVQVTKRGVFALCGGAIHNLAGALFDIQNNSSVSLSSTDCPGALFENSGRLRKSGGIGLSDMDVPLTNTGTLEVQGGTLSLGAGYSPSASSVLSLWIGGLTPGHEFGQIFANGLAALNGTLDLRLVNGFVPQVGNSFRVMTFTSRSGIFSRTAGLTAGYGHLFQVNYTTTNATLTVTNGGPPSFVSPGLTNGVVQLRWQGEPNATYRLDASTNLPFANAPVANWVTLFTTNTPSGFLEFIDLDSINPMFPRRFYRAAAPP